MFTISEEKSVKAWGYVADRWDKQETRCMLEEGCREKRRFSSQKTTSKNPRKYSHRRWRGRKPQIMALRLYQRLHSPHLRRSISPKRKCLLEFSPMFPAVRQMLIYTAIPKTPQKIYQTIEHGQKFQNISCRLTFWHLLRMERSYVRFKLCRCLACGFYNDWIEQLGTHLNV